MAHISILLVHGTAKKSVLSFSWVQLELDCEPLYSVLSWVYCCPAHPRELIPQPREPPPTDTCFFFGSPHLQATRHTEVPLSPFVLQRFPAPWQPSPPTVWPPPTDYDFSPAAEEETEEETEPLEGSPFSAATALMGTRLRSLEEEEERGGGGGHGDGVPDGDGGWGGDGRELGRL
ncbi:hypothetical protein TIFTF001_050540 [Ficus carica]|uniref:Uncharacterized protein n=1 Tax=Ficus carica TaxID=3494 RepID=A0AA87ZRP9_FICCA|nr:hypothetical protein TIFTF001_050540 [Ficus carica]